MTIAAVSPPNQRILASAGSGKTYQLTSRYLQLVAAGSPPEGMLATTFTRAAAGEIRNRIIMRLVEAAHDSKSRSQLAHAIGVSSLEPGQVITLLRTITSRLHRLQIRTLDSFFAAIVQSFALELGLPAGCAIVEETEAAALRDEAIRLMLDEGRPQELIDMLRQLSTYDSSRRVHDIIDRELTRLYELCRHIDEDAWVELPQVGKRLADAELADAIARLAESCPNPDNGHWRNGHAGDVARARARDWTAFIEKGIANKIITGAETFHRKPIDDACVAIYQPLIEHAVAVLIEQKRQQNSASRRLIDTFGHYYEAIKRRDRTITFSDLAPLLADTHRVRDMGEIYFRLDAVIDHLLLDEFQDTSIEQWLALRPIAQELVLGAADDRSFFCVGDVKQSIYGWRNAEPDILQNLPQLMLDSGEPVPDEALGRQSLARSYRSAQPVIDTVNNVFTTIAQNQALTDFPGVADDFAESFEKHDTNRTQLPGYAELRVMPRRDRYDDTTGPRLAEAAQRAAELHRRAPGMSIGILTRTNKALGRLLYELGPNGPQNLDVPAGGRGRGSLTDAPAVEAVLDLLQLADHPDDTVAAYHVANAPVAEVCDAPADLADPSGRAARYRIARRLRRSLSDYGYADTLSRWLPALSPNCDERELTRLLQLIELAETFDAGTAAGTGVRADEFIKLVETTEVPDVRPAPIQVMTIHKAKGLEFDAVILPDLACGLKGRTPAVVFERESITGPVTRICRYMNETLRAQVPDIEPLFTQHYDRQVRESLSLLYVALTRAKHALYMYIDPMSSKGGYRQSHEGVLLAAAVMADENIDETIEDAVAYQNGDARWTESLSAEQRAVQPPASAPTIGTIDVPPARQRAGAAAAPSAHDGGGDVTVRLDMRDPAVDDRGRAIHALFEQIEWLDDGLPNRDALRRHVRAAARHQPTDWIDQQIDAFQQMIAQPTVQHWLSRSQQLGDGQSAAVHTELPFVRLIDGAAQQGIIDRVVVRMINDTTTGQIIDYKTDRIAAEQAPERAERYRTQLEHYRTAAAELLRLDATHIECVVLFVAADTAVQL